MKRISAGIVDYRMGNLASVSKALEKAGAPAFVSEDPIRLEDASVLVLPGVGNFTAGMNNLKRTGLDRFVKEWASSGRPLVGICLGMQLFFEHSEEGDTEGLGILGGKVVRMPPGLKVPHMGWNEIRVEASQVLAPVDGERFYFVHSYFCEPEAGTAALTDYGVEFASAVEWRGIFGFQFHPEKSSRSGMRLLSSLLGALG